MFTSSCFFSHFRECSGSSLFQILPTERWDCKPAQLKMIKQQFVANVNVNKMSKNLKFSSVEAMPPSLILFFHTWNQNDVTGLFPNYNLFCILNLISPGCNKSASSCNEPVAAKGVLLSLSLKQIFCIISRFKFFSSGFKSPDSCPRSSKPSHHDHVFPTYTVDSVTVFLFVLVCQEIQFDKTKWAEHHSRKKVGSWDPGSRSFFGPN